MIVGTIISMIVQYKIGKDYDWEDMQKGIFPNKKNRFDDSLNVPLVPVDSNKDRDSKSEKEDKNKNKKNKKNEKKDFRNW